MTPQELLSLSTRFQNVSLVFGQTFFTALPFSVAQAMDQSPRMLTLLEQQLATAVPTPGRLDSIRLGPTGKGTSNGVVGEESHIILVDPNDFLSITSSAPRFNSGTVALRIAHEIGHTLDPAGEVNVVNYTDPLAYARARSRLEGFAVVTELGVYDDWAKNETNPYRSSYLSIDANQGNRTLAITFSEIKIKGKENGLSQEQIDTQLFAAAEHASRTSRPSSEPESTYFNQNVRDYVLTTLGVEDINVVRTISSQYFATPVVEDASTGLWSSVFTIPDQDGRYTKYTRASNGELVRERFTSDGYLIDSNTTPNGKLVTTEVGTTPTGTKVFRLSAPTGELIGSFTETPEGLKEYVSYGFSGSVLKTISLQIFDDGTTLTTVDYPGGRQSITTTAIDGTSHQVDTPNPSAPTVTTVTDRDRSGTITGTVTTTPSLDENNNPVPNTFDIITRDGAGNLINVTTRQVNPIDGAYEDATLTPPGSSAPAGTLPALSVTRTDAAGTTTPVHNTAAVGNLTGAATLFNDLYALYNAMSGPQTGNGLPILSGAVNLVNTGVPFSANPTVWQMDLSDQEPLGSRNDAVFAMHLIAAYTLFHWDPGLNDHQCTAANDDAWRKAA